MNGWIRQRPVPASAKPHECQPPEVEAPPDWAHPDLAWLFLVPAGDAGSLWRCGCGRLYRVGRIVPRGSLRWLPARWWQRIRHLP